MTAQALNAELAPSLEQEKKKVVQLHAEIKKLKENAAAMTTKVCVCVCVFDMQKCVCVCLCI